MGEGWTEVGGGGGRATVQGWMSGIGGGGCVWRCGGSDEGETACAFDVQHIARWPIKGGNGFGDLGFKRHVLGAGAFRERHGAFFGIGRFHRIALGQGADSFENGL